MARLCLSLMGPFQALRDGEPITGFESAKVRALLAYLAAEGDRPHPRETVAELLWPERPHGVALANLRHALANLRKAIGDQNVEPPCLFITRETLQFNPACDAFVDLVQFTALLAPDSEPQVAACQAAIALYRGHFLEGFSLDDSPEFEAWAVVTREQVDYRAGQALARLVRHCVEQRNYVEAAHWTQRQLDLEPWNEEVYRQLMWLLAQSGQRVAALRQYDFCMRMLAADQGIEPQPATRALAARIDDGDQDLGSIRGQDGKFLVAASGLAKPVGLESLPAQPTPFVGRVRELAKIAATLADSDCRLLTVVGSGGVGKTRLVIETARAQVGRFQHGICFVDLAPVSATELVPGIMLRVLDAPERGSGEARRQLLSYLSDKSILLVLDNCEHLPDLVELIAEIVQMAPALKIVATSRTRLNLREEWLQPLIGLDSPPEDQHAPGYASDVGMSAASAPALFPVDLNAYDATHLFLQCVRRLRPDYQPSPADTALIAHICRQLDGMPLGIELAASWTRYLSLSALVDDREGSLGLLSIESNNLPPRHRSMHAVFDHSWRLLDAHERRVLRQMSIFRGGFTRRRRGRRRCIACRSLQSGRQIVAASATFGPV